MPIRDLAGDAVRSVIRAYHGSPHNFDKFDASKIGTGEGAQAFGHGLYFAGDEGVANGYRRRLAGDEMPESLLIDGIPHHSVWDGAGYPLRDGISNLAQSVSLRPDSLKEMHINELRQTAGEKVLAARQALEDAKRWANPTELFDFQRQVAEAYALAEVFRKYKNITPKPAVRPGKTYEVQIDHPEESLLDWDAPIGLQQGVLPQDFAERLNAYRSQAATGGGRGISPSDRLSQAVYHSPEKPGSVLYHDLNSRMGPMAATQLLRDAGIPGIKYFDGQSRNAGIGTRNYVMFPGTEDSITILRKYGLLPATFAAEGLVNQPQPSGSKAQAYAIPTK